MINRVTYHIEFEDHTIDDFLRSLYPTNDAKFASYRVPHPLEDILKVKLQVKIDKMDKIVTDTVTYLEKDVF